MAAMRVVSVCHSLLVETSTKVKERVRVDSCGVARYMVGQRVMSWVLRSREDNMPCHGPHRRKG